MKTVVGIAALILAAGALILVLDNGRAASAVALNPNHQCTYCHGLHSGKSGPLLNDTTVEATCLGCHGPGGTAITVDVHRNDPTGNSCCPPFRVTCMQCHDPHSNQINARGNPNLKLVRANITAPFDTFPRDTLGGSGPGGPRPVVFEALADSFSFCDEAGPSGSQLPGEWDNVCDVCHASHVLGRHHYDGEHTERNHHNSTRTCTDCHTHANALSP